MSSAPPESVTKRDKRIDVIIPTTGETGVGKSYFINLLLCFIGDERRLEVGQSLMSCTDKPHPVEIFNRTPIVDGGTSCFDPSFLSDFTHFNKKYRIVILDTPGFGHSSVSDDAILTDVVTWLQERLGKKKAVLGGLIYLEDVSQAWPSNPQKNLEALERRCGEVIFDKVTILVPTTTVGMHVQPHERWERERLLRERLMIRTNATLTRMEPDNEGLGAWKAVFQVLRQLEGREHGTRDLVLILAGEAGNGTFVSALLKETGGDAKEQAITIGCSMIHFMQSTSSRRNCRLFVFDTSGLRKFKRKKTDQQVNPDFNRLRDRMQPSVSCRAGIVYQHALAKNSDPIKHLGFDTTNLECADSEDTSAPAELKVYSFNNDWSARRICADILNRGKDITVNSVLELVRDVAQQSYGQSTIDRILKFLRARPS